MSMPPYFAPFGTVARIAASATNWGGSNASVVMSWIGGTDLACPSMMIGGAAAARPKHNARMGTHGRTRQRGTTRSTISTNAAAAPASPQYAAHFRSPRPVSQVHRPRRVPGPEERSIRRAAAATAMTSALAARMAGPCLVEITQVERVQVEMAFHGASPEDAGCRLCPLGTRGEPAAGAPPAVLQSLASDPSMRTRARAARALRHRARA